MQAEQLRARSSHYQEAFGGIQEMPVNPNSTEVHATEKDLFANNSATENSFWTQPRFSRIPQVTALRKNYQQETSMMNNTQATSPFILTEPYQSYSNVSRPHFQQTSENIQFQHIFQPRFPTGSFTYGNDLYQKCQPTSTYIPLRCNDVNEEVSYEKNNIACDEDINYRKKSKLIVSLSDYTDDSMEYKADSYQTPNNNCSTDSDERHFSPTPQKKRKCKVKKKITISQKKILKVIEKYSRLSSTRRVLNSFGRRQCKKNTKSSRDRLYKPPHYISRMIFLYKRQPQ